MATIVTIAKIAETEIVRLLKTFKIWVFCEKINGIFEKRILFKIAKGGKFVVECVSNDFISLKKSSALIVRFFAEKNQKTLNLGKLRNYDEEECFFTRKKRFHLFESLLYKNGKAQNMPVVADRLVINTIRK